MTRPVRVRMAPSPTGLLHIGTARTTLFNYLFARRYGGKFIFRIEDTDQARSTREFEQNILDGIRWLGLDYDEGPGKGGPFAPYHQMQRLETYQRYADALIAAGHAYRCYHTPEELEAERAQQREAKQPPRYGGGCRDLTPAQIAAYEAEGRSSVVRFKMPAGECRFTDLIKGEIVVDTGLFGDLVIMKADGIPTYNFAVVVDDYLMEISHVIRGEDHISNTPKQILIYEALGWPVPAFGHIPLILNQDRSKMSKRSGPVAVSDYQTAGYLPAAIINYLAMLGWSPGDDRELFSLAELEALFDIDKVQSSPAVFNLEKLDWFNGQYIRRLSQPELLEALRPFLAAAFGASVLDASNGAYLDAILPLIHERIARLSEIEELTDFFFMETLSYDRTTLTPKHRDAAEAASALGELAEAYERLNGWAVSGIEGILRDAVTRLGWKTGELFMMTRIAVTGKQTTPPLFETMHVLGRDRTVDRLRAAAQALA